VERQGAGMNHLVLAIQYAVAVASKDTNVLIASRADIFDGNEVTAINVFVPSQWFAGLAVDDFF
jgi:hypothetical protein